MNRLPRNVGPYRIEGELGRGGMGVVLRARGPDRRVMHRDLKPENVLFEELGRPLVADLGWRSASGGTSRAATSSASISVMGGRETLGYMPTEQVFGVEAVGPQADVFALERALALAPGDAELRRLRDEAKARLDAAR